MSAPNADWSPGQPECLKKVLVYPPNSAGWNARGDVNPLHEALQILGTRTELPPAVKATLASNVVWFGLATIYFGIKTHTSGSWFVPKRLRGHPLYDTVRACITFLGGMNAALVFLNVAVLATGCIKFWGKSSDVLFRKQKERQLLLLAFAFAHATQFAGQLPLLRGRRADGALWNGFNGVFVIDGLMAILNSFVALKLK